MSESVARFIAKYGLLKKEGKYIVALSGGADSVALLLILKELGYNVEAAHCNFHLRGEEADRDEAFVKELCHKQSVALHIIHFDTREYASLHKLSIETAARELRYGYFENLRRDIDADAICVAHHRDDSVETILMNLTRGTGVNGLTGIKPKNGNIIRPLLCIGRKDIEQYLEQRGQTYVTDSTNLEADEARRNKFRLEIIPLLKEINPSVVKNIQATASRLGECQKMADYAFDCVVKDIATKYDNGIDIDICKLNASPSAEYILYRLLTDYMFTPSQVEAIASMLDAQTGKTFSSTTHELAFARGKIVVRKLHEKIKPMRIPEEGIYNLANGLNIRVAITNEIDISRSRDIATLDADKVAFPLIIRPTETADRFHPFGMKGTKLVSDYLTDAKKNPLEKQSQLVVVDGNGNIIWLMNERTDNRYRIDSDTKRVLRIATLQS